MIWSFQQGSGLLHHTGTAPRRFIDVNCNKPLDVRLALDTLKFARTGEHVAVCCHHARWWNCRRGEFCDFMGLHGAEIRHVTKSPHRDRAFITEHTAYLAGRLEKLYTEDQVDEWIGAAHA